MTLQYRTIEDHAAWADVSARGRLQFEGSDAAAFLHALVTNDVEGLTVGRGTYAAWLTPQGRMISDLRLFRTDTGVLAEVPAGLAGSLLTRFDQLIFSENVRISDLSTSTMAGLVTGGRAAEVVAEATGAVAGDIEALPVLGHLTSADYRILRTDDTALPTFQVWTDKKTSGVFSAGSLETIPDAFLEALRIEAARPLFGVDMTTETIPLEAGLLDRAISQTKGCYVGQEVVVRILHRGGGKVVKHLMQMTFDPSHPDAPAAGTPLAHDGKDVGAVTSAATSPASGRVIALGWVHRDAAVMGTTLHTPTGAVATITAFAG
jgi:folate-binding protein YgfZ